MSTSSPPSPGPHAPWTVLHSATLISRRPWLVVTEQEVALPNRQRIPDYLLVEARDYATIFAITTDGRTPLVRQYKHGVEQVCLDVPAGYLDSPAEAPLTCARRELAEEVGLVSDDWHPLGSLVIDTNRGKTRLHAFLALAARAEGVVQLDDTEALTSSLHTPEDVRERVAAGEIVSVGSVATILLAMDWLARHGGLSAKGG